MAVNLNAEGVKTRDAGSRQSVTLPNGVTTSYGYDTLGRLETLEHRDAPTGGSRLRKYVYTLDTDGKRTAVTETYDASTTVSINYTYDNLNRLIRESSNVTGPDLFTGDRTFTHQYTYDLVGNRITKQIDDDNLNGFEKTIDYIYNHADLLDREEVAGVTTVSYTYDPNGSLIQKNNIEDSENYDYAYNAEDRMKSAQLTTTGGTGPVTAYAYDPNGIKVQSGTPGNITNLLIDPNNPTGYAQVFEERDAGTGTISRSYVLGDDVLSQATTASSAHYLLYDGHGSTRLLTDTQATPAIAANYDFDAYGNALGFDPAAAATPLLYAGEYLAAAAGQYYLRARHYDTANGRFNRVDPFAGNNDDPQSLHKYAYAHANPASHIDPSGLSIMDVLSSISIMTVVVGGFLGAAIGAVVGGGIAGYLHIVENETFEGFWDAVLNGALWGALYGALIGAAGAVSVVLLAITIATVFGINLYHAIPILMSPDIKPQTKIALIIILIVTAWLGTRAVVGAALRPKVVNPRASLPEGEHANFSGQAKPVVYTERSGALFRLSPKGGERGSHWGKPAPESELVWRQKMAWEEEFGNAESLTILRIPKGLGLKGFEGETAGRGPAYPGGGRQTYFPKEDIPLDWIQTVDFQATQQIPASTSGSGSAGGGGGG